MFKTVTMSCLALALFLPAEVEAQQSAERTLENIAAKIDREVGRPLQGFRVIRDSRNVDVEGDTYSATYRAEARRIVNLDELRKSILAGARGWKSGDVAQDHDSLDITFEKAYPAVMVDGERHIPKASVTISATTHASERKTEMNYDVDITLEGQGRASNRDREPRAGAPGSGQRRSGERPAERTTRPEQSNREDRDRDGDADLRDEAREAIQEAEEALAGVRADLREDGETLDPSIERQVRDLIARAKRALAARQYQDAIRLSGEAEALLDDVDD